MNTTDDYAAIPYEMRHLPHWVVWGVNQMRPKCPYSPSLNVEAKANNPDTWGGFDEALAARAGLGRGGIGFEFGQPGGIAGIDLDHVLNDAGEILPFARDIVQAMDSYTEISPSGHGLHILFTIKEPLSAFCDAHKRHTDADAVIEVYDTGRYFTVTGKIYGEAKPLNERTDALKKICAQYLAKPQHERRRPSQHMSRNELWERMFNSPAGAAIRALKDGDISAHGGDASAADQALCNHLAYWTGNDARLMDEMFREAGLMRPKWDERRGNQTYGQMTIARAVSDTPAYIPKAKSGYHASEGTRKPAFSLPVDAGQLRTVSDYLQDFLQQLLKSRGSKAIPTGFEALDGLLGGGLYPGLYCLGAISSLGKTTFALQIADAIAKAGHGVMVFSLEMSRYELMAKTISREAFMKDLAAGIAKTNAQTTRGILSASFTGYPKQEALVRSVLEEYADWAGSMTVIEGGDSVTASTVGEYVQEYMNMHGGNPPVVMIDYLQMLDPPQGLENAPDKRIIDKNVKSLKQLSRDYEIPVICISSFNRESYTLPVSMSSFKESGGIEYSSDVLIGLQYAGVDYQDGEGREKRNDRVCALIERARMSISQGGFGNIEAKILKNRNGRLGRVSMQFNARYNYFREEDEQPDAEG